MLSYIGQHFDWRDSSACKTEDADLFYSEEPADQQQAKAICATCQCRAECLATAMLRDDAWGVWGGMTPQERMRHGATWLRRMGGNRQVKALRERTGLYANGPLTDHLDRRYTARLKAARECRDRLMKTDPDFPSRDLYLDIMDMIIRHPTDEAGILAGRTGLSKTWFNRRKREAFLATGIDESTYYESATA